MADEKPVEPSNPGWAAQLERMGAASEEARRRRLRALTLEAGLREFEELYREVLTPDEKPPERRSHPVGLVKYTRRS